MTIVVGKSEKRMIDPTLKDAFDIVASPLSNENAILDGIYG